jgi:hypothetical protein
MQPNVHAAWRLAVAEQAARAYARNGKLAALTVAGSVGAGLADQFSDLELDCYWFTAPDELDRTGPVDALGGEMTALWDYDAGDQEWSEDYRLGELDVTVSNFLTSSIEGFLDEVILRADTDPVKHMRLAAVQRSRPLVGAELVASWRARAGEFPATLVTALVDQALTPRVLTGWAAREALASRGDDLALQDLLARTGAAVVRAVLALNRVYLPHPELKWQRHLIAGLDVAPEELAQKLALLSATPPKQALETAETLLADTAALAETHAGADMTAFRAALAERRRLIYPPKPLRRYPAASQSSATAAVQDCRSEPSAAPVNGSKYSANSPPAASWLSESRRSSSARPAQPSWLSASHSSQLMIGQTGPRQ